MTQKNLLLFEAPAARAGMKHKVLSGSAAIEGIHFDYRQDASGIIIGDAYHTLQLFRPNTFRCCVTSPPYWGLRDYGIPGQIGAEMELRLYLENLTEIFREVRRVLKDDGRRSRRQRSPEIMFSILFLVQGRWVRFAWNQDGSSSASN